MLRLKTTTVAGKVSHGPFVYKMTQRQANRKLGELDWLIPKYKSGEKKGEPIGQAAMKLIEVSEFPKRAEFKPNSIIWDFKDSLLIPFIKTLEDRWEEIECRQLQEGH